MTEYHSLDYFKEENKISDGSGVRIAFLFEELFEEYLHKDQSIEKMKIDELLEKCKEVNQTLIPYAEITNTIFSTYFYKGTEIHFPEKLKSEFEKLIVEKFSTKTVKNRQKLVPKNNEDLFNLTNRYEDYSLRISDEDKNAILVFYKIIQQNWIEEMV